MYRLHNITAWSKQLSLGVGNAEWNAEHLHLLTTEGRPKTAQEGRLTRQVESPEKSGDISSRLYNELNPSGSQPPRIYGLPKMHKPEIPLRPIVSCIRSQSYHLSKFITSLIFPLEGKTSTHMKNSKHFLEALQGVQVAEDELLVSFDISSLFTNVSINRSIQVIQRKLEQDNTLANRTTLSPNKVAELLEVCLRSTYFSYGGDFYKQREGAAMGSPVSASVANLYMEFFEDLALSQAPADYVPSIWKR